MMIVRILGTLSDKCSFVNHSNRVALIVQTKSDKDDKTFRGNLNSEMCIYNLMM